MSVQKVSHSLAFQMPVASTQNDSFLTRLFQKIIQALFDVFSCCKKKTINQVTYQQPTPNPAPPAPVNQAEPRPAQNPDPLPQVGVDPAPANNGEPVNPELENSILDVILLQAGLPADQFNDAQCARAIDEALQRELQHIQQLIHARPVIEDQIMQAKRTNLLIGQVGGNIYHAHADMEMQRRHAPRVEYSRYWSSEIDQMICMIDAAHRGAVERNPRTDLLFAERLLEWKREGLPGLDFPHVREPYAGRVLNQPQFAQNPKQAAKEVAENPGNQALVRATALAAIYHDNIPELVAQTIHFAEVTHNNDASTACSVAVNVAIALLMNGIRDKNTIWNWSKSLSLATHIKKRHELNHPLNRNFFRFYINEEFWPSNFDELERIMREHPFVLGSSLPCMAAGFAALSEALDDIENGISPDQAVLRVLETLDAISGISSKAQTSVASAMLGAALEAGSLPPFFLTDLVPNLRGILAVTNRKIKEIRDIHQREQNPHP